MIVTPNTIVRLIKSPIELDQKNQLTFDSRQAQENYFLSLPHIEETDFTFQRKDNTIEYPTDNTITFEDLLSYTYCMYKNQSYGDKWFYAFITNIEYLNDYCARISIETDVFQTWFFDTQILPSFVERCHVNDDTIGRHTLPEGLETGEFTINGIEKTNLCSPYSCHVMVTSTINPKTLNNDYSILYGNGQGVGYYLMGPINSAGFNPLTEFIYRLSQNGQIDAITGIFLVPDFLTNYNSIEWDYMETVGGLSNYPFKKIDITSRAIPSFMTFNFDKNISTIDGYTPSNKKLFTAEFNYLLASNNNGMSAIYHYEDFLSNTNCTFDINGVISAGCSIRIQPYSYKNQSNPVNEYGLSFGKLPILNFLVDMYTNWLSLNSVNINGMNISTDALSIGSALLGSMSEFAKGLSGDASALSGIPSSFGSIASSIIAQQQHERMVPQSRGSINSADLNFQNQNNEITFYKMSIKQEYAKIIDEFFDRYGYKVNRTEVPHITGRRNWNYVKTIDIKVKADIPQQDLQQFKNMFDDGLTLWHNPSTFMDYFQNNDII